MWRATRNWRLKNKGGRKRKIGDQKRKFCNNHEVEEETAFSSFFFLSLSLFSLSSFVSQLFRMPMGPASMRARNSFC